MHGGNDKLGPSIQSIRGSQPVLCNFHAPPTCKILSASPRTPKDSSSCDTRPEVQDLMIYIGSRCILNKTYKLKRQVVCSLHTQDTCKKCFHLRRRRLGHVVIGCTMLKSTGQIVPTSLTRNEPSFGCLAEPLQSHFWPFFKLFLFHPIPCLHSKK